MALTTHTSGTLTSGTLTVPYMPMTIKVLDCAPPILKPDFERCRIPGGIDLWTSDGFYSPGQCFIGYRAACTQTAAASHGWPIRSGETVVKCVPQGFECHQGNHKFATTEYDGTILSAPAFEIRWKTSDLANGAIESVPGPDIPSPAGATIPAADDIARKTTLTATTPPSAQTDQLTGAHVSSLNNPALTNQQSGSHPPLTLGTITAIVVGVSLTTLGMILTVIYIFLRRRRPQRKTTGSSKLRDETWDRGTIASSSFEPTFMEGDPPIELGDQRLEPKELPVDASTICNGNKDGIKPVVTDSIHFSLKNSPAEMPADAIQRPFEANER